jgi:hypothetical protein
MIIDAAQSLSPFIMIFDENGTLLESSMKAGNTLPVPPAGVFDFTRSNNGEIFSGPFASVSRLRMAFSSNVRPVGEDRFTWQTASGLRFATVIVYWTATQHPSSGAISSGFVLAARSLREIENREGQLELIVGIAWIITLVIMLVSILFGEFFEGRRVA